MRIVHRLLTALAALLLAVFAVHATGAASAVAAPETVHTCAYDNHDSAPLNCAITDRGPPSSAHVYTAYDAGDRWSHGESVCSDPEAPPVVTTCHRPAPPVEGARGMATTWEHVRRIERNLASFARAGVAANTAPKALAASSRVAPWAGSSLSRLSREGEVMYRVYGGGAGKAGSWLTPINPISSAAARQGLALPAENAALYVSKVTLPGGVRMQVGTAGSAFGQPGGWAQAQLLERIPLSSFGKGVPLQ